LKYARDVSETPYILEYEPLTETIRERAEKPPFDGQTEYAKYKYAVYYPPTESIYVFQRCYQGYWTDQAGYIEYNPVSGSWTQKTIKLPIPTCLSGAFFNATNETIYLLTDPSGRGNQESLILEFNPSTNKLYEKGRIQLHKIGNVFFRT
jgi:hypothetical protein